MCCDLLWKTQYLIKHWIVLISSTAVKRRCSGNIKSIDDTTIKMRYKIIVQIWKVICTLWCKNMYLSTWFVCWKYKSNAWDMVDGNSKLDSSIIIVHKSNTSSSHGTELKNVQLCLHVVRSSVSGTRHWRQSSAPQRWGAMYMTSSHWARWCSWRALYGEHSKHPGCHLIYLLLKKQEQLRHSWNTVHF